jgi:DNA-binding response OmpR family regulator
LNTTKNSKKRILLVDDEPKIGNIFSMALKLSGYDVVSTTSGIHAIELVKLEKFDIMLLDLLMVDISGLEVLSKVRAFSSIPVIVFSAKQDAADLAKRFGANDFIAKPLNPEDLVTKIKFVLHKASSKIKQ